MQKPRIQQILLGSNRQSSRFRDSGTNDKFRRNWAATFDFTRFFQRSSASILVSGALNKVCRIKGDSLLVGGVLNTANEVIHRPAFLCIIANRRRLRRKAVVETLFNIHTKKAFPSLRPNSLWVMLFEGSLRRAQGGWGMLLCQSAICSVAKLNKNGWARLDRVHIWEMKGTILVETRTGVNCVIA
jgi:hypothetical protein